MVRGQVEDRARTETRGRAEAGPISTDAVGDGPLKQTRHLKMHLTIKPVTNDFLKFDEPKNEICVFLRTLATPLENCWEWSKAHQSRVSLLFNVNSVFCPKHGQRPSRPYMRAGTELKCSMGAT